jgi:hypothetical protein
LVLSDFEGVLAIHILEQVKDLFIVDLDEGAINSKVASRPILLFLLLSLKDASDCSRDDPFLVSFQQPVMLNHLLLGQLLVEND